jgi:hypothetical protein
MKNYNRTRGCIQRIFQQFPDRETGRKPDQAAGIIKVAEKHKTCRLLPLLCESLCGKMRDNSDRGKGKKADGAKI